MTWPREPLGLDIRPYPPPDWDFFRWRKRRALKARVLQASRRFDLRSARWLATLCVPLTAANLMPSGPATEWAAAIGGGGFAVLLCLYFAWILFRRLQCSLLELMAIVAFLGNAEGLLFSTPGVLRMTAGSWALAPLLAAWVLYGAVMSLAQGRLLGLERSLPRLLLLFANWFILAAPAMLIAGAFLGIGEMHDAASSFGGLVSPAMARWGGPLAVAGLSGCCLHFWLAVKTGRKAREILGFGRD